MLYVKRLLKVLTSLTLLISVLSLNLLNMKNVRAEETITCDSLLRECAGVAKQQNKTIKEQEKAIEAQQVSLNLHAKEIERLHKKEDRNFWVTLGSNLALLLVFLL